ncbi:MAG: ThiF family adenylyltransferase [Candidatus Njordarchaeia archaeon]
MFTPKYYYVIGAGGIGSWLLPPLVRTLVSDNLNIEYLQIWDGDKYEESNSFRQEFAYSLIGKNKAEAQTILYTKRYGGRINILAMPKYISKDNIHTLKDKCVIFSCVDNHVCRKILSNHAKTLSNVLLISGGNELHDGNVQAYYKEEKYEIIPPIEDRHPEIATTDDGDRSQMSCEEIANLPGGGQIIVTNLMAATLMFNLWYIYTHTPTDGEWINEIFFNIKTLKFTRIVNNIPD